MIETVVKFWISSNFRLSIMNFFEVLIIVNGILGLFLLLFKKSNLAHEIRFLRKDYVVAQKNISLILGICFIVKNIALWSFMINFRLIRVSTISLIADLILLFLFFILMYLSTNYSPRRYYSFHKKKPKVSFLETSILLSKVIILIVLNQVLFLVFMIINYVASFLWCRWKIMNYWLS